MSASLYAGKLTAWADSMAKAIEDSLDQLYQANGLGPLPTAPPNLVRERRLLFIAIANGVINHLKSKEEAFEINFTVGPNTISTNPSIDVTS